MRKSEQLFTALGYKKVVDSNYFNKYIKREPYLNQDGEYVISIKQDSGGMVCMTVNDEVGWFKPDEIEAVNEMCKEYYRRQGE